MSDEQNKKEEQQVEEQKVEEQQAEQTTPEVDDAEERLRKRIEELRKRDPFIYR